MMIWRSRKWVLSSGWVHYLPLQALWPWAGSLHSLTLHFPINKMMLLIVPTSGLVRKVKRMSRFNILLSQLQLFATPWTVAHEAPLSIGFSRQEYRNGLPSPSPVCLYIYVCVCVYTLHFLYSSYQWTFRLLPYLDCWNHNAEMNLGININIFSN